MEVPANPNLSGIIMRKALFFFLFGTGLFYSQVIIGSGKTQPTNDWVSLEFGTGNLGLVLPYVTDEASVAGAVNGTIIYDQASKKVKIRQNGVWVDFSIVAGEMVVSQPASVAGNEAARVVIGTETPTTPSGILVLEDTNKAMILPQVSSPHLTIINPAPGMMVYDPLKKQVAVFNGSVWSFWE